MTIDNEQMHAIDAILRRGWIDPMRAFADAAHAAREDVERCGSVPDRMMLLTQQRVVLRLGERDGIAHRFVWLALAPPGGDWSHVRIAATALAARHEIAGTLIVTMRGDDLASFLCLAFIRGDAEPIHLRAAVTRSSRRSFIVGEFARTSHPWADALSPLAGPTRNEGRQGGTAGGRLRPRLRVLRGGKG